MEPSVIKQLEILKDYLNEEYLKYEKMDEETLFITKIRTNFGLITNIESLVHCIYWIAEKLNYVRSFPIDIHLQHQFKIISILEKKFSSSSYMAFRNLDDPTRETDGYGHYNTNGRTGFMSSLLINCSFILYDYFLQHGVIANVWDDSFVIFIKLININISRMPREEIEAIKNIFKQYKRICKYQGLDCPFVNGTGYTEFNIIYNSSYNNSMARPYYKKFNGRYDFETIINNNKVAIYGKVKEILEKDKTYYTDKEPDDLIFNSDWEYYPEYYDRFRIQTLNVSPEFIFKIRDFLIGDATTYESKYLKYKMKYLALKKLLEE
jgi:hypothetical protein